VVSNFDDVPPTMPMHAIKEYGGVQINLHLLYTKKWGWVVVK
jgi:hypothetical protein